MSSKKGKGRGRGKHAKEDEKETLAFRILTAEHTKELCDINDVDELQEKLLKVFPIEEHETDLKAAHLLTTMSLVCGGQSKMHLHRNNCQLSLPCYTIYWRM